MDEQTKKVLHQQLELLAERSKTCADDNLADITQAMCTIADRLPCEALTPQTITLRLGAKAFTAVVEDCAVENARSGGALDDYEVGPKLLTLANRNYSPEMKRMLVEWSSKALSIAKSDQLSRNP